MHLLSIPKSIILIVSTWNLLVEAGPIKAPLSWSEAYAKASALVGQMTIEQKVNLTTGDGWMKTLCVGNVGPIPELDFPSLCLQDSPLGLRFADNVTAGVSGINAAASFDKEAIFKRGAYIGDEARRKGVHFVLGPCVDIMRSPAAGRGWEAFGEDPYLNGVAGREHVLGLQSQGAGATAKHFIANNQETNRKASSSDLSPRTLHEVYLWPYARMVEAGLVSVMCSYNQLNGTFACEDEYTLNTVLKGELGFQGFVMSDWGATMSTVAAANNGLDMTMPGDIIMGDGYSWFGPNLTLAIKNGDVSEARLTDMATRIAAAFYKMGQDHNYPETTLNSFNRELAPQVVVSGDHYKLVREMGAASAVLLKNNDILPLSANALKKIAIIGSDGGPDPKGLNSCEDHGCADGTLAMGWGSGTADFPYLITPKDGLQARAGNNVEVDFTYDNYDLVKAAEVAKGADIAFVFSNADAGEEYIVVDGNNDRKNLSLWNNGDNLINAVAEANENTVVVIHSVGPVMMPWIDHPNIKAVVWAGLPGQESGNSLADVVFGDVNPSGRLPYTIAKSPEDYGAHISTDPVIVYNEGILVGYRWFDAKGIDPLFEFGFGLSYTTFGYSDLKINTHAGGKDVLARATVVIANTGDVDGAEVVQAYIGFPESAGEPPKVLRGFEKVFIRRGKKSKVTFDFGKTELSYWDTDSATWIVPSGEFTVYIGASSRDIRLTGIFEL